MGVFSKNLSPFTPKINKNERRRKERSVSTIDSKRFVHSNNDMHNTISSNESIFLLTEETNDWTQHNCYNQTSSSSPSSINGSKLEKFEPFTSLSTLSTIPTLSTVSVFNNENYNDNINMNNNNDNDNTSTLFETTTESDTETNEEISTSIENIESKKWLKIEEDLLIKCVKKYGGWNNWNLISQSVSSDYSYRSVEDCKLKWKQLKMNFYFDHDAFAERLRSSLIGSSYNDNDINDTKNENRKRQEQFQDDYKIYNKKMKLRIELE